MEGQGWLPQNDLYETEPLGLAINSKVMQWQYIKILFWAQVGLINCTFRDYFSGLYVFSYYF